MNPVFNKTQFDGTCTDEMLISKTNLALSIGNNTIDLKHHNNNSYEKETIPKMNTFLTIVYHNHLVDQDYRKVENSFICLEFF